MTGYAKAMEEDESPAEETIRMPIKYTSTVDAQLLYREDGTLHVPNIRPFVPATPTVLPSQRFPLQLGRNRQFPRFTHQSSPGVFLIYTDGACLNDGQADPAAGWGLSFAHQKPIRRS